MEYKTMTYSDRDGLKEWTCPDLYKFACEQVGGFIESVPNTEFYDRGILVYFNEEGKFMQLPPCVALEHNGKIFDQVVGTIVFVRYDEDVSVSLTDDDISYINNWYETTLWHISADLTRMIPIIKY